MAWTPELVVFVALGLIIIGLACWLERVQGQLRRLGAGRDGASLEETILEAINKVKATDQTNEQIKRYLEVMDARLRRSIQHVKTVRFNPFREQGQGSNQSFAAAFLDEHGNGVVLSSLYTRDKVSIYAKPVTEGRSEFELTEEEQTVLK